ncbi:Phosphorelay intermediate protein, partial [Ophidiomyces ophidiicola]
DFNEVSQLGHFLKGSSATLGLTKVKDACEKLQHFGARKDESGTVDEPDNAKSLASIKKTLTEVKEDYDEVAKLLKDFYGDTTSS